MTSILADNTELPTVSTKRGLESITSCTRTNDSLGKVTFASTSLPRYSGIPEFVVSTSRPRYAIITNDTKKDETTAEDSCSVRRELLKDNMEMLNQALSLMDMDDASDSDSESESEDDESLFWS
jgi:hypothetical protein